MMKIKNVLAGMVIFAVNGAPMANVQADFAESLAINSSYTSNYNSSLDKLIPKVRIHSISEMGMQGTTARGPFTRFPVLVIFPPWHLLLGDWLWN